MRVNKRKEQVKKGRSLQGGRPFSLKSKNKLYMSQKSFEIAYNALMKKAQDRVKPAGYTENHHINPRCLGGGDEKRNRVDLTAKEHYFAHEFLTKIYPDNSQIWYAWICMCFAEDKNQKRYKVTAEQYEAAKIALSKLMTGNTFRRGKKNSPEQNKRHSEFMMGNVPSEATRIKLSEAGMGRVFTQKEKDKIGDSNSKNWEDPDFKEKNLPQVLEAGKISADKRRGIKNTEEHNTNIGRASKNRWDNPEYRTKMLKHLADGRAVLKLNPPERDEKGHFIKKAS